MRGEGTRPPARAFWALAIARLNQRTENKRALQGSPGALCANCTMTRTSAPGPTMTCARAYRASRRCGPTEGRRMSREARQGCRSRGKDAARRGRQEAAFEPNKYSVRPGKAAHTSGRRGEIAMRVLPQAARNRAMSQAPHDSALEGIPARDHVQRLRALAPDPARLRVPFPAQSCARARAHSRA